MALWRLLGHGGVVRGWNGEDFTLEVEGIQIVLFNVEAQVEGQWVLTPLQGSSLPRQLLVCHLGLEA